MYMNKINVNLYINLKICYVYPNINFNQKRKIVESYKWRKIKKTVSDKLQITHKINHIYNAFISFNQSNKKTAAT